MIIDKIIVFFIFTHVIVYCHSDTDIDHNLTLDQLEGRWFVTGSTQNCIGNLHPCKTYEMSRVDGSNSMLKFEYARHHKIHNCDNGILINYDSGYIMLVNSTLYARDPHPRSLYTIKSYNNGEDLILIRENNRPCAIPLYSLWSKERHVSAEMKAEFEKLAGNETIIYHSWDNCAKLVSERTSDAFTLDQIEGTWYTIRLESKEELDNGTCTINDIKVNHNNGTLDIHMKEISNGHQISSKFKGNIVGSTINFINVEDVHRIVVTSYNIISCNNGTELLWTTTGLFGLLSRHRTAPRRTVLDVKRLANIRKGYHF